MRSLSDFFLISTNSQPSSCRPEPVLRWPVPFKHRHKSDGRKADGHPPLLGPLLLPLEDLSHRPAHLRGDPQLLGTPPSLIRYNLKKLIFERKNSFHLFSDSCSDYVDTTSGYHSLESETGPFLLPLTRYNKRLLTCFFLIIIILSSAKIVDMFLFYYYASSFVHEGLFRAPVVSRDIKSNKQFFTFHRPQGQSHQDWGGRGGGTTSPRARVTSPSPRTRGSGGSTSPRNRGSRQLMASHSRTMEPKKVEKAFD